MLKECVVMRGQRRGPAVVAQSKLDVGEVSQ